MLSLQAFHTQCTQEGKKSIRDKTMRILIRTVPFSLQICRFQFVDWGTKEICGFAICKLIIKKLLILGLAHRGYLHICDLQTNKKNVHALL